MVSAQPGLLCSGASLVLLLVCIVFAHTEEMAEVNMLDDSTPSELLPLDTRRLIELRNRIAALGNAQQPSRQDPLISDLIQIAERSSNSSTPAATQEAKAAQQEASEMEEQATAAEGSATGGKR